MRSSSSLIPDDGWIIGTYGPPLTPDHLRDYMIAPHQGSPIDVFLWSVGGHEVYDYETEVGELFGTGYDNLDPGQQKRYDNLRALITTVDQLRDVGLQNYVRPWGRVARQKCRTTYSYVTEIGSAAPVMKYRACHALFYFPSFPRDCECIL